MRLLASVLFMCVAARAERLLGTETFKEAAEKLITPRNFTMSVTDDDGLEIGRISVAPDQEPIDIVHPFCLKHGLTTEALDQILDRICRAPHMRCTRSLPLVYSQSFHSGEEHLGDLNVYIGQEPVDVVHAFAKKHGLGVSVRLNILSHICASGKVECTRIEPLLYTQEFADDTGRDLGFLSIYEGQEPADIVYEFARENGLDDDYRSSLLQHVCANGRVVCTRTSPVIFSQTFADGDTSLGVLEILEGQEPVDAVDQFCMERNLPVRVMVKLLSHVCNVDGMGCNRMVPLRREAAKSKAVQLPVEL